MSDIANQDVDLMDQFSILDSENSASPTAEQSLFAPEAQTTSNVEAEQTFVAPEEPVDGENNAENNDWTSWINAKLATTKEVYETSVKPAASKALEKTKEGVSKASTYVAETEVYKTISHKIDSLRGGEKKEGEEGEEHQEGEEGETQQGYDVDELGNPIPRIRKRDRVKAVISQGADVISQGADVVVQFVHKVADEAERLRVEHLVRPAVDTNADAQEIANNSQPESQPQPQQMQM